MNKIAVVYWSGTGNTEEMAKAVANGVKDAGAAAEIFEVESFTADKINDYDAIAFGCPAMGDEVLEESCFEPFFAEAEGKINGKAVALFGSYGWGGGAWLDDWRARTETSGAKISGTLAVENSPNDDDIAACEELGKNLAATI